MQFLADNLGSVAESELHQAVSSNRYLINGGKPQGCVEFGQD